MGANLDAGFLHKVLPLPDGQADFFFSLWICKTPSAQKFKGQKQAKAPRAAQLLWRRLVARKLEEAQVGLHTGAPGFCGIIQDSWEAKNVGLTPCSFSGEETTNRIMELFLSPSGLFPPGKKQSKLE